MGKVYFVFQDKLILSLLENYAAAGKFDGYDVVFMYVKDSADFSEKGTVITKGDAVIFVAFEPDCERHRVLADEFECPHWYCDEAGLKVLDLKRICKRDQQAGLAVEADEEVAPFARGGRLNA